MPLARPSFQEAIFALERFWAQQGCVIWQPYYTQVGAGTMNPATFLRVLGPEPWRVAYVEPSVRPADARYGENPNRLGLHYQYQVILKPDPGNPQQLYLDSLSALGIDPAQHDIRFVEDNWEAPVLGAWGLGWEVWLDGQEITQFTYFQQAGGMQLDPVSVEITYGMERILMALQGVDHYADICWNQALTYGDLFQAAEREHSTYFFETGDVERLRAMYEEFLAEARASLAAGLMHPAYDYLLKCSHTFNLLDSRGAIGVTERASVFAQLRETARAVAQAYLDQRQALGYPWRAQAEPEGAQVSERADGRKAPARPATFLLEVGVEELPPADLQSALTQLGEAIPRLLDSQRLAHGELKVMGTPRRLIVWVEGLVPKQEDHLSLRKGPPADKAYDGQGRPTQAAAGFAKGVGIPVELLQRRELEGGVYVVAEVHEPGRPAHEVLGEALPGALAELRFDRGMRWNEAGTVFSRPVRWMLALHGRYLIPFEFAGVGTRRETFGLRFEQPASWQVADPAAYLDSLNRHGIIVDVDSRRRAIWEQVTALAAEVEGEVAEDPELLAEVSHLVERPTALRGRFDPSYLELPREVLISVMKTHQRYFPIEQNGSLLPHFITVRNGGREHSEIVVQGNEQVIRSRFADAAYFIARDRRHPLESYRQLLDRLVFQTDLGSVLKKVERVERLARALAQVFALEQGERRVLHRAAHLCKADLATQMVVEMTSLQGVMGREYALASGEEPEVAQAIFEHYLPRFAGDSLPASMAGAVLGLADRLDSLMALFALGLQPTGTRDPYALRRAALGLIQILIARNLRLDLCQALDLARHGLELEAAPGALDECLEFIRARQQGQYLAAGRRYDVVEAVLAEQGHDPTGAAAAIAALERWVGREDWPRTLQAYARCARITRETPQDLSLDAAALVEPAEAALFRALESAEQAPRSSGSVDDFLTAFKPMIPAIDRFFDEVLVMTEQEALRRNRLAMLQRVVKLARCVADLSRLEGF